MNISDFKPLCFSCVQFLVFFGVPCFHVLPVTLIPLVMLPMLLSRQFFVNTPALLSLSTHSQSSVSRFFTAFSTIVEVSKMSASDTAGFRLHCLSQSQQNAQQFAIYDQPTTISFYYPRTIVHRLRRHFFCT